MNSSPKILVVYKKSRYEQYVIDEADPTVMRLIEKDHVSVHSLLASHKTHRESLESIIAQLNTLGLRYDCIYRGDVVDTSPYDLIVAVGGDGTVLDLSHRVNDAPMLAINSDPKVSVGYFTAGTAKDFARLLDDTLLGRWEPVALHRFAIKINGQRCGFPVLNDVLVTHANPAAVSHYLLKVGNHSFEEQKSSGIWIATPAGSTGAIRSAGGYVLPYNSDNLQYLVREPYPPKVGGYRFLKGIQPFSEPFEVISRMRDGRLFLDGPHSFYPFTIGDVVSVDPNAQPLQLYGIKEERRTA
ncbi:MAG: NAD(+)/NADH kinase [Bradymonadaceae bacterium]|nr:NAD(+)/NADH kinase [Lujinxingiaceae bacterium]